MTFFSIWVDADSCPAMVRNHLTEICIKNDIPLYFVANRPIPLQQTNSTICMIVCKNEQQAADDYIFSHCNAQDIVITKDIPFAAKLLSKKAVVMNDRGTLFTEENIKERLSERDFNLNLAMLGLADKSRKSAYSAKEFKKFADCFERELQKLLIINTYGNPKSSS